MMVSKFLTQFQSHERVFQELGSGLKPVYTSLVLDDGTIELAETGQDDLYAFIQSHKDSCDINVLLARYKNGDIDALQRVQGVYGDFTNLPTSYAEWLNVVLRGEQMFNALPVETREKFDHDFSKFMAAMDNMPEFLKKVGFGDENVPAKDPGQSSASDVPSVGSSSAPDVENS